MFHVTSLLMRMLAENYTVASTGRRRAALYAGNLYPVTLSNLAFMSTVTSFIVIDFHVRLRKKLRNLQ